MPKTLSPRDNFEKQLAVLVENYSQRENEYKRADYTESQARIDFIDPLFEALGWDVRNAQKLPGNTREVIVESGQTSGRPDYNFRLNGKTQFFVEAKAPHVPLDSSRVILQAKKYAFNETSQMVLLSAVTDFEEFRLYEVRDKSYFYRANKGLIFKYRYDEYLTPKALDDLWKIGRKSVEKGSLDVLITPAARRERQRIPLDQQFLFDLEEWREKLAKSVFKAHHELEADDLNSVVQVFLDRLIFIRVAEDRGVLPENQLWEIARHWTENKSRPIISELLPLFRAVNQKLNGEIFKPHRAEEIHWDSALVVEIIDDGLEPYNFAQIGVELLGSIYERYLGKTIRVTDTRAIVEEKPEIRKAGGVYYTPKYIVDYIVAQTVGKLIEGKTPKQIEKLKILDPACGSGSFLLGAYQALLDYHTRYYAENAKKKKAGQPRLIDAAEGGEFRLSLGDKAAILCSNIFGVDIDPQAVEITMMSLYIKMLEGERGAITGQGVLPRLRDNIKCGNSLIARDIEISADKRQQINPFDWDSKVDGFGEIMEEGGFDAVIGNPPYGAMFSVVEKEYLFKIYPLIKGQPESYEYFLFRSLGLVTKKGFVSFIVPTNFTESERAEGLREALIDSGQLHILSSFRYNVWKDNASETLVIVYQRNTSGEPTRIFHPASPEEFVTFAGGTKAQQADWLKLPGKRFLLRADVRLIRVIEKNTARLETICDISQGIIVYKTRADSARNLYISEKPQVGWKRLLDTKSTIQRYNISWGSRYLKYGDWLCRPRDSKYFEDYKILFVRLRNKSLARKLIGIYDEAKYYNRDNFNNIILKDDRYSLKYVLGLFNSKLLNYWYKSHFDNVNINPAQVRLLPIRTINFSDPVDKSGHDKMVALVERMLDLQKQKQAAKGDAVRERIEREINVMDEKIDALVYELYGLTKEEIKIVEGT